MSVELHYLVYVTLFTSVMWMPYILEAMRVRGVAAVLGNPSPDAAPLSPWADRAKRAHANAVENLVLFAPLVIAVEATGASSGLTAAAAKVYLAARIAHFAVYTAGVPVVRTLCFVVGFGCQIAMGVELLG